MRIRHRRYPELIVSVKNDTYQFKDFECDMPTLDALSLLKTTVDYETVDPLPAFNPDSWLKERKLLWDGPFGKANGFGNSSEQMLLALSKVCDVYAIDTWRKAIIAPEAYDPETLKIFNKKLDKADLFHIKYGMFHTEEPLHLDYSIAFTMFETDFVPNNRITHINQDKALFVPCKHNEEVFRKCGVTKPIYKVPLGVNQKYYHFIDRKPKGADDIFTFYIFGGLSRRKGVYEFLEAFVKEFPKEKFPNVRAIIKNVRPIIHGFQEQWMPGQDPSTDERITWEFKVVNEDDMLEVLKKVDCGVFPTKGEGFGLPPIETAATGAPTIVTNISGCAEYANPDYFYLLDAGLEVTYDFPKEMGYVGNWGKIDIMQLRHHMKYVYNHHAEALGKGRKAAEWIKDNWSYDDTARIICETLDKMALQWKENYE